MRSGVVGLMPAHPRDITAAVARRLRAEGFTGVTVVVPDPLVAGLAQVTLASPDPPESDAVPDIDTVDELVM